MHFLLALVALSSGGQLSAKALFNRCQSSVVTVRTSKASGTGFVVRDNSTVVTCYHVVKDNPADIHLIGASDVGATLVAYDEALDVAVLRASVPFKKHLSLWRSSMPDVGTKVFVIGTPLGFLDKTMSDGLVSGKRRIGDLALIQITAAISHGSSGGPVLVDSGEVVGMVRSSFEQGQSLNLATSSHNILSVLAGGNADFLKRTVGGGRALPDGAVGFMAKAKRSTSMLSEPIESSVIEYSFVEGESMIVRPSGVPGWLAVSVRKSDAGGDSYSYVRAENVIETDVVVMSSNLRGRQPKPVSGPAKRIAELIDAICHAFDGHLGSDDADAGAWREEKELLGMGPQVIQPILDDLATERGGESGSSLQLSLVLGGFYSDHAELQEPLLRALLHGPQPQRKAAAWILSSKAKNLGEDRSGEVEEQTKRYVDAIAHDPTNTGHLTRPEDLAKMYADEKRQDAWVASERVRSCLQRALDDPVCHDSVAEALGHLFLIPVSRNVFDDNGKPAKDGPAYSMSGNDLETLVAISTEWPVGSDERLFSFFSLSLSEGDREYLRDHGKGLVYEITVDGKKYMVDWYPDRVPTGRETGRIVSGIRYRERLNNIRGQEIIGDPKSAYFVVAPSKELKRSAALRRGQVSFLVTVKGMECLVWWNRGRKPTQSDRARLRRLIARRFAEAHFASWRR